MTATVKRTIRRAVTLRRGDDYRGYITLPDSADPADWTFLAQIRADTDGDVLAEFEQTADGQTVWFVLDGETVIRDLPNQCGADLQVWYLKDTDDEIKLTPLEWTFSVVGDYSREEEGS